MLNTEVSIITPTELYVKQLEAKNEKPRKQIRTIHDQINPGEIKKEMSELGRYIVQCRRRGQPVRVPALQSNEWGHVLRTIELMKSFY
ncbi:hypothetical protein EXT65_21590 [Pectobacterium carotovorum subsp. carotovorum]|nr:hypothetical protein [Pectobacterium carotovorum]MCL6336390.1 hypothetical protein [Pectobacterium carotovorum subsp. carotovorum]